MILPKLKSAFSYEMGQLHLSVHSLQNLRAPSGLLPYTFKASPPKKFLYTPPPTLLIVVLSPARLCAMW